MGALERMGGLTSQSIHVSIYTTSLPFFGDEVLPNRILASKRPFKRSDWLDCLNNAVQYTPHLLSCSIGDIHDSPAQRASPIMKREELWSSSVPDAEGAGSVLPAAYAGMSRARRG